MKKPYARIWTIAALMAALLVSSAPTALADGPAPDPCTDTPKVNPCAIDYRRIVDEELLDLLYYVLERACDTTPKVRQCAVDYLDPELPPEDSLVGIVHYVLDRACDTTPKVRQCAVDYLDEDLSVTTSFHHSPPCTSVPKVRPCAVDYRWIRAAACDATKKARICAFDVLPADIEEVIEDVINSIRQFD